MTMDMLVYTLHFPYEVLPQAYLYLERIAHACNLEVPKQRLNS